MISLRLGKIELFRALAFALAISPLLGGQLDFVWAASEKDAGLAASGQLANKGDKAFGPGRKNQESATVLAEAACPAPASAWERYTKQGEAALKSGAYGEAERLFNQALAEANKSGHPGQTLVDSLENLAALYQARGQFAKEEPLLEKAMSARGRLLGVESSAVLISLCRLGQFYLSHGKTVKAERLYGKLLEFTDRKLRKEERAVSDLNSLDEFYAGRPELAAAPALVKRLKDLTREPMAFDYPELAVALDNLACAYQKGNKLAFAEELYKRALKARGDSLPADHLGLAASFDNLASVYVAEGKFAMAEPLLKKSLALSRKQAGPPTAADLNRAEELAACYRGTGRGADAQAIYEQMLEQANRAGSGGTVIAARLSLSLAEIYMQNGKYALCEPLLKRALTTTEAASGPQHASVAPILDTYAGVLKHLNRQAEAAKLIARSKAIRAS
jgi:hypothetical protein